MRGVLLYVAQEEKVESYPHRKFHIGRRSLHPNPTRGASFRGAAPRPLAGDLSLLTGHGRRDIAEYDHLHEIRPGLTARAALNGSQMLRRSGLRHSRERHKCCGSQPVSSRANRESSFTVRVCPLGGHTGFTDVPFAFCLRLLVTTARAPFWCTLRHLNCSERSCSCPRCCACCR